MLIGMDIAVLGGGIAGLALARALAMRGASVTIYERATAIREVGAGLQISPNGARVLSALGCDPAGRATRAEGVQLLDGALGREVLYLDFLKARPRDAFYLMHRADLITLLAEGIETLGVSLKLSHAAERISEDASGVDIAFADGQRARHGLVLGADGLHSKLRPVLNGPATPFFTGQTAWRATVPAIGGEAPVAMVHMAKDRHVVCYPLRDGEMVNIVAVEERVDWAEEGWHHQGDPEEMRRNFSEFAPGVQALLARVDQVARWGLFRHPVAAHWHSDRLAILGDAAHPTLPFLAQGANMALEDAWVLAECLSKLPLHEALPAYQSLRQARVERAVATANANARRYHMSGLKRIVGHTALRMAGRLAPNKAVDRFSWLYDYDVTTAL